MEPSWLMPAETAQHKRVWMAFPPNNYLVGESDDEAAAAFATWANVANAIVSFTPVTMLVDPSTRPDAEEYLDPRIELIDASLDDAWMRDIGPSFVLDASGNLGAVDWVFNGWGAQLWSTWDKDTKIGARVGALAGADVIPSPIVNEGGGIHVDGEGTILLTETVQLDPERNPGATKDDIEAEMRRCLGVEKAIWLPRGLTRDYDEFGTRGHVDIVATFSSPGTVLLHWQDDPQHPDYEVCRALKSVLEGATDAHGRTLRVVELPAPQQIRDDEGFVDYSYVNHLVTNEAVIACTFDDPRDARALEVLREAYPGRTVVGVDAREIYARGGGIHCITQQEPAAVAR